jgi:hypothetical protein
MCVVAVMFMMIIVLRYCVSLTLYGKPTMNIIQAIQRAQEKQIKRKYEYLYWCIDIHGTLIKPTYELNSPNIEFYPYSLEVLGLVSDDTKNKLILWTSSHVPEIRRVMDCLVESDITVHYANRNPDYKMTDLCDFSQKFYFDILLDDKAGFEPETDWQIIFKYLINME